MLAAAMSGALTPYSRPGSCGALPRTQALVGAVGVGTSAPHAPGCGGQQRAGCIAPEGAALDEVWFSMVSMQDASGEARVLRDFAAGSPVDVSAAAMLSATMSPALAPYSRPGSCSSTARAGGSNPGRKTSATGACRVAVTVEIFCMPDRGALALDDAQPGASVGFIVKSQCGRASTVPSPIRLVVTSPCCCSQNERPCPIRRVRCFRRHPQKYVTMDEDQEQDVRGRSV